jgi:hypothetical protein
MRETKLLLCLLSSLAACEGALSGGVDAARFDRAPAADLGGDRTAGNDRSSPSDRSSGDRGLADRAPPADVATGCAPIPGVSYGKLATIDPYAGDASKQGDMNLLLRSWKAVAKTKGLVDVGGPADANAPQLYSLFADDRVPGFPAVYQVEAWDWGCNCPKGYLTDPEVTLAGMAVAPGEVIQTPKSGYDLGGGAAAIVLHAAPGTLTLKYTREDNVVKGYTIHLAGICVEPSLQALYDALSASGRKELPALKSRQPLGRATGTELQASIRDTGSWMDPRVRKDWWQGK